MLQKIWQKWCEVPLVARIVAGMIMGGVLALSVPQATSITMLGTLFVSALKAVAPILVFVLVIAAIAQHQSGTKTNLKTIIGLYVIGTFSAGLVAVVASFLFPVRLTLAPSEASIEAPSGIGEVIGNVLQNLVANPVTALTEANYIGILVWAVALGLALKQASAATKAVVVDVSQAVSRIVQAVIQLAPFGILGLIYEAIAVNGLGALAEYGRLLAVLVGVMLIVALVINPLLVAIVARCNPYPLVFLALRESGLTAFFTRSSAANIPVNMRLSEKLGLNPNTYSVSIPLGATINMAGAAVTIAVLSLATVHTLGIDVDFATALLLVILSAVSATGASGVAGGSLLLIPLATSLFGVPADVAAQVVGIGFIVGVVQDASETALNSSSDVVFTAAADYAAQRQSN